MKTKETAVEWLEQKIFEEFKVPISYQVFEQAKQMEKENSIAFFNWMRKNDTMENAERFFHYTDEDMYNVFLEETYGK